jgi:general secretion pathway protein A
MAGVAHERLRIPVSWKNLVLLKSNLPDDSPHAGVPEIQNKTGTEKSRTATAPLHLTDLGKPSTQPVERPATGPLTERLDAPAPAEQSTSKPATERLDDPAPAERSAPEPGTNTPIETRLNEHPTSKPEAGDADLETDSKAIHEEKPIERNALPLLLGQVELKHNDSLWRLIEKVYGVFTYQHLNSLMKVNPHIRHPDHTEVGQLIYIPALPAPIKPMPTEVWWIKIGEEDHLDAAINRLRSYPKDAPPVRLVPYWNRRIGLKFAVILKDYFFDEASARNQLSKLLPLVSPKGKILSSWVEDTVFFADPLLVRRR